MPTYTPNIPQPTDNPSQSQNQILENFQVLATAFSANHGAYNAGNQGQHAQVTFPVGPLTGQPFTYLAGQIGLQSLNQAPTGRPDIWLSRGVAAAFPATGYVTGGTSANNGWSYLPSGWIIAGGIGTMPLGGTVTLTYATELNNFPGFSTFWMLPMVWPASSAGTLATFPYVNAFTATTVTVNANAATGVTYSFGWLAIGF